MAVLLCVRCVVHTVDIRKNSWKNEKEKRRKRASHNIISKNIGKISCKIVENFRGEVADGFGE